MQKLWRYLSIGVLLTVWACSDIVPSATPTPQPTILPIQSLTCTEIARYEAITCLDRAQELLLQVGEGTTVTLSLATIDITLDDTLFVKQENDLLSFILLAGRSVIGSAGETRILQIRGTQVTVLLDQDNFVATSPPSSIQNATATLLNTIPSHQLPRPISVPRAIMTPRDAPTPDVQINDQCSPPPTWNQFYTVQRGDSLYAIAQAQDVTLEALLESNCITNNLNIFPGDLLRIPDDNASEQNDITFVADRTTLAVGECTTIFWQATGTSLVYFQGEAVAQETTREVCPQTTTTYALLIVFNNGAQDGYTQTITVSP